MNLLAKGFKDKDGKFHPTEKKHGISSTDVKMTEAQRKTLFSKPSLRKKEVGVFGSDLRNVNAVIDDQGNFTFVPFSQERQPIPPETILKLRKERILSEIEKENVTESIADIVRIFPEGIVKIKSEGKGEFSIHGDNPRYEVELLGGIFTGDIENLKKQGIDITSVHGTKDGNIKFNVQIPKKFRISSPKKEKKIEFGMKNIGLPHIKKGMMEISSGNINETEQEMLRMQFEAKRTGIPLTKKQKERIAEIERMADPHEIGLTPSPFRSIN